MSHSTFVFDVDIAPFQDNRVFDQSYARQYPGAEAFAALAAFLRDAGMETVTADVYLRERNVGRPAVCLSNELTRFTDELLSFDSVVPVACMSLESPICAIDFYRRIREVSERFHHVFLWGGMRESAGGGATFHEISWPYPDVKSLGDRPSWSDRKFLVLINSNKRIFIPPRQLVRWRHPRQSAKSLMAAGWLSKVRRNEPWLTSELYKDRLDAIRHFADSTDFDLFGRGWSDTSTLSGLEARAVNRSYRGELPALAKVSTLSDYRFALCFENTSFPGYITEKIFDCFAAGCIPVYLGAPDIRSLIPAGAFIDARDFSNLTALESFIRELRPEGAGDYITAATEFMSSRGVEQFTQRHFVREMSGVLLQAAGQATTRPRTRGLNSRGGV